MLPLASATSPAWVERAVADPDTILLDHAHCEKKAAGSALNLLFRYPEHEFLQEPLSKVAREELEHFERVLAVLQARGTRFGRQKPSAYGGRLHAHVRTSEPARLIDLLLVSALIEARSCERFRLLAGALQDAQLAALYADLLASEARHHRLFARLAERLAPPDDVQARLGQLAAREAEALVQPSAGVRLHS